MDTGIQNNKYMENPPDEWLDCINHEFRAQSVDVRRRPFLALGRYCQDFKVQSLMFGSPPAKRIFDWFCENTKPESHHIDSLFAGVFYYDTCFWAVDIPIGYGRFHLEAPDCLRGMSPQLKKDMMLATKDAWSYALFWADCIDYAFGLEDLTKDSTLNSFGAALLQNGDKELRAAVSQLLEHRPNSKAAMSSRLAVELFLKAFLALKAGLTESCAKDSFGHNLKLLIDECRRVAPQHDLLKIEQHLSDFPNINERYTGGDQSKQTLWAAYSIAQYAAASVVRSLTDRDTRFQLQSKLNVAG